MCNPMLLMVGTQIATTAFSAYTQVKQGEYARDVGKYNARVAENEAERVRAAGTEEEMTHREKVMQLLSQQRAQLGAANVDIGSGSALQLQEDTLTQGEADALRIRSNIGEKVSSLKTQAKFERAQGEAAYQSGVMGATGSLLSGAASVMSTGVADKWFKPNSAALNPTGGSLGMKTGSAFSGYKVP